MAFAKRKSEVPADSPSAAALARLRGGSRRTTVYDVAQAAGVSAITVSRALNGGSCSPATRERVRQAARQLGYQPNPAAQALASGKRKRAAGSDAHAPLPMPQVWQSYADIMVGLMRPKG